MLPTTWPYGLRHATLRPGYVRAVLYGHCTADMGGPLYGPVGLSAALCSIKYRLQQATSKLLRSPRRSDALGLKHWSKVHVLAPCRSERARRTLNNRGPTRVEIESAGPSCSLQGPHYCGRAIARCTASLMNSLPHLTTCLSVHWSPSGRWRDVDVASCHLVCRCCSPTSRGRRLELPCAR